MLVKLELGPGAFTPEGERGPSNVEELLGQLTEMLYSQGYTGKREITLSVAPPSGGGSEGYLIEVPRFERGGRGRYWAPNACGYAVSAVTAGVYTRETAEAYCRGVDYDLKAVPDPLGREPGEVIDLGYSWEGDPMLAAYQAGLRTR